MDTKSESYLQTRGHPYLERDLRRAKSKGPTKSKLSTNATTLKHKAQFLDLC